MRREYFIDPHQVEDIISLELKLHPLARPVDIYKLLIQAAFGPGHLLTDPLQVKKSLRDEMADVSLCNDICSQSLDAGAGFMRYYLCNLLPYKAISDKRLEVVIEDLTAAMFKSCENLAANHDLQALWSEHLPLLGKRLVASEKEWQEVQYLANNNLIPSHSPIYKAAYQPHYRVIKASLMPKKDTL